MVMAPGQRVLVVLDDDELQQSGWVRRSPDWKRAVFFASEGCSNGR